MINSEPIFPYKAKIYGAVFLFLSMVFAFLYFSGYKPDYTYINVFTVFSVYIEKNSFEIIQTNILDELAAIFLILGVTLIVLSKEKEENSDYINLRLKAMFTSILFTSFIWTLSLLLVYGLPIFVLSSTVFIFFLIIYYTLFKYLVFKSDNVK